MTAIAAIRTNTEIVVAADSCAYDLKTGATKIVDKILPVGKFFAAVNGLVSYHRTGFDVFRVVEELQWETIPPGFRPTVTHVCGLMAFPIKTAYEDIVANDPQFLNEYFDTPSALTFIGIEDHIPVISGVRFAVENGAIRPSFDFYHDKEAKMLVGSTTARARFAATFPNDFPNGTDLISIARDFVQQEIDSGKPTVGPPIDILRVTNNGYQWVQKKMTSTWL